MRSFNPRARAGRDVVRRILTWQNVSIHAPARGATPYQVRKRSVSFNPRARAGRDWHDRGIE